MPGVSGVTVVTMLVCSLKFCMRGCGCFGRPAFPAPSDFLGKRFMHDSGASRRGNAQLYRREPLRFPVQLRPLPGLAVLVELREERPEIACFLLVLDAGEDHLGAGNLRLRVLD